MCRRLWTLRGFRPAVAFSEGVQGGAVVDIGGQGFTVVAVAAADAPPVVVQVSAVGEDGARRVVQGQQLPVGGAAAQNRLGVVQGDVGDHVFVQLDAFERVAPGV